MKLILIFVMVAVATISVGCVETYDSKYDDFDIGSVLSNKRLLKSYVNCLLDKGPCTPEAKKIKEHLPEALSTNCEKCTADQKALGKKVALEVMQNHPDYWKQLAAKYDPEGKYQDSFQEYLRS